MPRKRTARELVVAMNGLEVGRLTRVSGGALRFRYVETWLAASGAIPISLSMPLSADPYAGDVVWSYFDNLLPDSDDLRRRMQVALGADSAQPFDLLAKAGADCVGALQLGPSEELPPVDRVDAEPVSDARIAEILRGHRERPLGMTPREDGFRISVAGVQEKTAFLWHDGAWHRPRGTTPTSHLFKLPIGVTRDGLDLSGSVENEWLCLRLAAAFGLSVAKAEIQSFEDVRVLVVERFDRRWSRDGSWLVRLPQEDLCQALGLPAARKYESDGGPGVAAAMDLLLRSEDPAADRRAFFKAVVVFWLLGAIDGHAKNFSLFLHSGGRCRSTPLYDVMSAYPMVAAKELDERELRMSMAASGKNRHYKWAEITGRHWRATAERARLSSDVADEVLAECQDTCSHLVDTVAAGLEGVVPHDLVDAVLERVGTAARRL